jgi:hypothetical protein
MKQMLRVASCLVLALWLAGCSTVTGDFHQKLQIDALDSQNRPVDGMQCQVGTGSSAKTVVTPASDVRVRRALQPLVIECRRENLVASATVKSRRERMEEALLPFGSAGVFIDHLSGALYAYPTSVHLRVGQHLVLEHGGEAQVVTAEPIVIPAQPAAAAPQRVQVATVDPVSASAASSTAPTAKTPQKAHSVAPKTDRAPAKPVKSAGATATTVSATATTTKPRPVTTASATPVHNAPVNW